MADPRRLGKRGAYRLGRLRLTGKQTSRPPARTPSFRGRRFRLPSSGGPGGRVARAPSFGGRRSRGSLLTATAACAAAAALLGLGAALGWWFLPFVAGITAGAGPWRLRIGLPVAGLAVLVGWGAALWWPALSGAPAGATARVIAALAGLPPFAVTGVAAVLLIGVLQVLVACWLARALTGHRSRSARLLW